MVLNLDGLEVGEILQPKHNYESAVVFGTVEGAPVVVKTFAFHAPPLRALLGWLCRREARLLRALDDAAGPSEGWAWLPQGARQWGRWGVLMRRMEGRPIKEYRPGDLPPAFLRRLEELVTILHRERIVHLDLKNGGNILVRDGEFPVLLDFAGCLSFRRWPWLGRAMTRWFGRIDRAAVVKWKRDYLPESLTAEERALLERVQRLRRYWPFPIRRLYKRGTPSVSTPQAPPPGEGEAPPSSSRSSTPP